MPIYVNNSDGSSLTVIQDGQVDNTTSLSLPGKGFPLYGQNFNQNFVNLLQNFASTVAPSNPQTGQLWFNINTNKLNFYNAGWHNISNLEVTEPSTPTDGNLWWDSSSGQLKVYTLATSSWTIIGPNTNQTGIIAINGNTPFIVQIGGNNVFSLGTTGILSNPYQPVVNGTGRSSSGSTFTTLGLSQASVWIPSVININQGNYFSPSSGLFTVPVTGVYEVMGQVQTLGGTSSGTHSVSWWKNSAVTGLTAANFHDQTQRQMLYCNGFLKCSAGDTIQLLAATDIGVSINNNYSILNIRFVG